MLPTAGFIPPPVVPLVPNAINGIVATGGLLAGAAAGASVGTKAGSLFGPKGVLIGAVAGALLLPLLLPDSLNPGVVPGLDPGLNPKESPQGAPWPQPTDEPWLPPGVPDTVGVQYLYKIRYQARSERSATSDCKEDKVLQAPGNYQYYSSTSIPEQQVYAYGIKFEFLNHNAAFVCGAPSPSITENSLVVHLLQADGTWLETNLPFTDVRAGTISYPDFSRTEYNYTDLIELEQDGASIPLDGIYESAPPKPRTSPVPFTLLPEQDLEPAIVPIPDPEPQTEPLVIPSPDNPDVPPITIPQAPPAPPQEVPDPDRDVPPGPYPITPEPVLPPLPVPGVPTVPEPSPDPNLVPAPSPDLPPVPGPSPLPSTDPDTDPGTGDEPAAVPTPVPPGTPSPGPIVTPASPEEPQAVDPGTGIVPEPISETPTTPTDSHFPVTGGPAVTPGGTRQDLASIAAEVGRIEQKVARIQRDGALGGLADLLWLLPLLEDFLEGPIPGTNYQLQGVCEDVAEGESQPIANISVAGGKNLGAVINRLDAMQDLFQQHLEWRTPICRGPKKEGEFRTISFISDEKSPNGDGRVAKRFRYRSSSGLGLEAVVDHWRGFVWSAGPVVVKHADAPWGTPQVWAASIDEGKRVLRHAAGESGFDPDQVGRWVVGGSNNPRYGVPGTMRVNTSGGYWWITARDGASERPQVVLS